MSDAPNLMPCPFCGCTTINRVEQDAETVWHECRLCQAVGPVEGFDQSGEPCGWNRSADLSPAPVWQPIETAPKDGTAILASGLDHGKGPNRHYSVVEWMDFGCKSGWYSDEDAIPLTYLTHWMPLPAPPSEGVEP